MEPDNAKLKVVRHDPRQELMIRTAMVLVLALLLGLAYWLGGRYADYNCDSLRAENDSLTERSEQLHKENRALHQQLAILHTAEKMDQDTVKQLREMIKADKEANEVLTKELTFYKNIFTPTDKTMGIRVAQLTLDSGEAKDEFYFNVVMSQVRANNPYLRGTVTVNIVGLKAGQHTELPLSTLASLQNNTLKFGFRYFQTLPNDNEFFMLKVPADFVPQEIIVRANVTGGVRQRFEQTFQWDKELDADVRQQNEGSE